MTRRIGDGLKTGTASGVCGVHGQWEKQVIVVGGVAVAGDRCPMCAEEAATARSARDMAEATGQAVARRHAALDASGVGRLFWAATFENYSAATDDQRSALVACKAFVDMCKTDIHTASSMILFGRTGTGKTHLACAIVTELLPHMSARRVRMIDMIGQIRSAWGSGRDGSAEFCSVSVLIIDEVGVQYGTDAEKVLVQTVVDKRYEAMLPTVFVTNLGAKGLREELTDRVMRRVRDGGGMAVPFDWAAHGSNRP